MSIEQEASLTCINTVQCITLNFSNDGDTCFYQLQIVLTCSKTCYNPLEPNFEVISLIRSHIIIRFIFLYLVVLTVLYYSNYKNDVIIIEPHPMNSNTK